MKNNEITRSEILAIGNAQVQAISSENKYMMTTHELPGKINGKHSVYRIIALKDFGNVKTGDIGGYIESEYNLSQKGNCWIGVDAIVAGYTHIDGDTIISDDTLIWRYRYQ